MNSPLLNAVNKHNKKNMISMHMPAHKGAAGALAPLAGILPFDLTELPDTGSLFDSEGATAEAERLAAAFFKSEATLMSAGGNTLCIQTMLRLAAPQGGKVIFGRVVHRSAVNAMALLGIEPVWVLPDDSEGKFFSGRIEAKNVKNALEKHPEAKAVYVTSPDYFGVMSDIAAISEAAERRGIPLIVDNAHGAHLGALKCGLSPLENGAAMSADSAHKTLPVLTGGAWLNISKKELVPGAKEGMALFGSTSPSYPVLISLDLCRAWLEGEGAERLCETAARVEKIKAAAAKAGFAMPLGRADPLRIALSADSAGISGEEMGEFFREQGIEPEYAGNGRVILIPSPFNSESDFERLNTAVEKAAAMKKTKDFQKPEINLPEQCLTPGEALFSEKEKVDINGALNRVAGEAVCPCPPAVPAVIPGEKIDKPALERLKDYGISALNVVKFK